MRPFAIALALMLGVGCAPDIEQVEPPRVVDRIFDGSANGVEAIAYLTREARRRPGPGRLTRHFDHYTLSVRRLPDGALIGSVPLGDTLAYGQDSVPSVIGVADTVFWLRHDSLVGYRLASLAAVRAIARHATLTPEVAALRDTLGRLEALPEWRKPGMARLFTAVPKGLQPMDSLPRGVSPSLVNPGVLMRADRTSWRVDAPASVLVMSTGRDSTWSLSRVTTDGTVRWTTPLSLRFMDVFVVLDLVSHVVFADSEAFPTRAGRRDRVVWVNVASGTAHVLEVATGVVTVVTPQ